MAIHLTHNPKIWESRMSLFFTNMTRKTQTTPKLDGLRNKRSMTRKLGSQSKFIRSPLIPQSIS